MKNIQYIHQPTQVDYAMEYLEKEDIVAVDTETNGLDPITSDVLLLQVGNAYRQYVFDIHKLGESLGRVLTFLSREDIEKVMHNAKFDYSMILSNFGVSMPNVVCTYMGASLLTKGIVNISNGLDACLDKYLNIKVSKEEQKSFVGMKLGEEFTKGQIDYAGADVEHLIRLKEAQQDLLDARGMGELFLLESETTRVCGDLEVNGIFLNKKMWLALAEAAKGEAGKAKDELDEFFKDVCQWDIFGKPVINYNSPTQLQPLLEKITGQKLASTGVRDLERIDHPVIKALLKFRGARKKVTTYGEEFIKKYVHKKTGRLHSDFRQLGTDSGRMASRNPNMQNIPSADAYRHCFRAQGKDYKMISADFSGQELRLLAHISKEREFLFALENNMDLHSYSASLIFGVDYKNFFYFGEDGKKEVMQDDDRIDYEDLGLQEDGTVTDHVGDPIIRPKMKKKYRTPAKSITFGLIYGMGPGKLADTLDISIPEAIQLINKYFKTFPTIKKVLDDFTDQAMKNKYAYSPLDGRRRIFSGVDWDHDGKVAHMKNIAKNQPFQGAGASVTKLAMCRMKEKIDVNNWDAKLINVVHDEILIEVHESIAQEVAETLETEMCKAFNYYAPSVPMVAKAEIADHWVH